MSGSTVPSGPVTAAQYQALATSQYQTAPNFLSTIQVTVQPFVDLQNVMLAMPSEYDIDNAVGAQLDTVGLWVGLSRYVSVPLSNVYFSWNTAGLGWNQGYWRGPFSPLDGVVALPDDAYRFALLAKVQANQWKGSFQGVVNILNALFNSTTTPGTYAFVQDLGTMKVYYGLSGQQPNALYTALFTSGYIAPEPAGIVVEYYMTSVSGTPIFGLDMDNSYVAGLDVGAWGTYLGSNQGRL